MKQSINLYVIALVVACLVTSLVIAKTSHHEFDVVGAMQKQIKTTQEKTDGTPCRYKSTFELDERGNPLKAVHKVYFSDYRRASERQEHVLVADVKPVKVVQAVHNVATDSITVVERHPESDKKLSTQKVLFDRA